MPYSAITAVEGIPSLTFQVMELSEEDCSRPWRAVNISPYRFTSIALHVISIQLINSILVEVCLRRYDMRKFFLCIVMSLGMTLVWNSALNMSFLRTTT